MAVLQVRIAAMPGRGQAEGADSVVASVKEAELLADTTDAESFQVH
jgi:hypothetical protein